MPKTVIVSGGFDPLHSGHIAYLQAARNLGDYLVVGVNSDAWLICKKGRAFMPLKERMAVVRALGCVGEVMSFDDSDGTALKLIEAVKAKYPQDEIVFANGGDRTAGNIPEMAAENVAFAFGVGGSDKLNRRRGFCRSGRHRARIRSGATTLSCTKAARLRSRSWLSSRGPRSACKGTRTEPNTGMSPRAKRWRASATAHIFWANTPRLIYRRARGTSFPTRRAAFCGSSRSNTASGARKRILNGRRMIFP
jgi:cytidyltransferase-like protein